MKKSINTQEMHRVESVLVDLIIPSELKMREEIAEEGIKELAESMSRVGLLHPILLMKEGDRYRIIAGERRYHAARLLRWKTIPARVVGKDFDTSLPAGVHENIFRVDLSPVEEAQAIKYCMEEGGWDIDKTARAFSKSRRWVEKRLEILAWDKELKEAVHRREIPLSAAEELSQIKDPEYRKKCINDGIGGGISHKTALSWRLSEVEGRLYQESIGLKAQLGPFSTAPPVALINCNVCDQAFPYLELEVLRVCRNCLKKE